MIINWYICVICPGIMRKISTNHIQERDLHDFDRSGVFQFRGTWKERYAFGKGLRDKFPRSSHSFWKPFTGRPDPIELIHESNKGRIPDLVPLRHGRMVQSPFTFYRAGALNMASDLANTPDTGIKVQCCGDAHLSNFGGFATPERNVIFSINDLDETLPAPWEWDLKRLAVSFVIACRNNGLSDPTCREIAFECSKSYRQYIEEFSEMKTLALWYYSIDSEMLIGEIKDPEIRKRIIKRLDKEREKRIADEVFPKLAHSSGENVIIKDHLPTIFHWAGHKPGYIDPYVSEAFRLYRESLSPALQVLLDRYELKDIAIKVVGVGSVGTRCWILLMVAANNDHLLLQAKEARPSVLESFAGKSIYDNHGQRIVNGYRLMQTSSDIFLGWTRGHEGKHFYFRQLRDMKISALVETFGKAEMNQYARWCSHALALAHARSGDAAILSGYMGKSNVLDEAIADFSIKYADQNEKDYNLFKSAVKNGKLKAIYE